MREISGNNWIYFQPHNPRSPPSPFLSVPASFSPMPTPKGRQDDQPEPQDDQPEPHQDDRRVVATPQVLLLIHIAAAIVQLSCDVVMDHFTSLYVRTPYHTSILSGAGWVQELLTGHPQRIRNELGVYRGTFTILVKAMQKAGLQSSRHVSVEEQVSIFLYTAVTGMTCTHVGERFQRSSSTITK